MVSKPFLKSLGRIKVTEFFFQMMSDLQYHPFFYYSWNPLTSSFKKFSQISEGLLGTSENSYPRNSTIGVPFKEPGPLEKKG